VNIHYLQHADVEGPGQIGVWAAACGHKLTGTHLYRGEAPPDLASVDFLVILGGGMNVYQHRDYPWLVREKEFIGNFIGRGKPVLGVCLGAQLIADVLGGKVYQNPEIEIGWYPIRILDAVREHPFFTHLPAEFTVMHWHGDTFDLPPGATLLASSDACKHQAYICEGNVIGVQFHIELRPEEVRAYVEGETAPLPEGKYVQSFEQILAGDRHMTTTHRLLCELLDALAAE